jgi:hypothetical protein
VRFCENGADIPDDLIRAASDGVVTFLCGAGVSFRVGLPSFKMLTEHVYAALGETWQDEPPERNAMEAKQFDRALRCLERRTVVSKSASRVRAAVANILQAPPGALPDHLALLKLSRDEDGRPKILTTNFDTLFERAAHAAGFGNIPSYACKAIPRPGSASDHGVLHLHGRLADGMLSLSDSELVLTSADFGDAYLRDGWASRYIEDRMRLGILVLVGYAAEDVAMRLLLETLDADRSRFRDLNKIYAMDKFSPESASLWDAKGIIPVEFSDYDRLYQTVSEWAAYATDPAAYREDRVRAILGRSEAETK